MKKITRAMSNPNGITLDGTRVYVDYDKETGDPILMINGFTEIEMPHLLSDEALSVFAKHDLLGFVEDQLESFCGAVRKEQMVRALRDIAK